jgi:MATE family, multidrug efflux pump
VDAPAETQGELRAIAVLAGPIALAQAGLVLMALVDTAILGHTDVVELAGAAMGRSTAFAALAIGIGVALSLEPLASQALGAGEPEQARRAWRVNLRACLLAWAPCTAAAFALTTVLAPLGVEPRVVEKVREYIAGQAPGMALTLLFLSTRTFLQAHGRTMPALVASALANLVNVGVCSVLVRGDDALTSVGLPALGFPRLGALGAGLAYSVASVLLFGIVTHAALRVPRGGRGEQTAVRLAKMFRLGVPIGSQMLAEMGVFTLAALLAGGLGTDVVASHQIAIGLASFTFMGALGVSGATAVRVGLAVGGRRPPRRAGLTGIALGAGMMSVSAVVFAIASRDLVRLFTDKPEVIELGAGLVRIAAAFQLFDGVQAVATGALRGAGDVRFPFVANVIAHWFVGFPAAVALCWTAGWGARGLWWGLTAGLVAISIALAWRFAWIARGAIARA